MNYSTFAFSLLKAKGLAVKVLILTVKLQAFLFDVLGNNNVFPCLGYMITPVVYQHSEWQCLTYDDVVEDHMLCAGPSRQIVLLVHKIPEYFFRCNDRA